MERTHDPAVEQTAFDTGEDSLDELHGRIAHHFRRPEVKERVRRYVAGLLSRLERKNGFHEKAIRCQEADVAAVGFGYSSVPVTLSPRFHPHSLMSPWGSVHFGIRPRVGAAIWQSVSFSKGTIRSCAVTETGAIRDLATYRYYGLLASVLRFTFAVVLLLHPLLRGTWRCSPSYAAPACDL